MMHQPIRATRQFDTPTVSVVAVDGHPDKLALYDPGSSRAWLTMQDPLDLREYR